MHKNRRLSKFPGKESSPISFNLTAFGRQIFKEQARAMGVSQGDYLEMVVWENKKLPTLSVNASFKKTGPKGGAKSYFFGKDRGTTTTACITPAAHIELNRQSMLSEMSRGDFIEYLLRERWAQGVFRNDL